MGNYLFLLLILVCPLAMFFMMRGMSGGMSRGQGGDTNSNGMESSHERSESSDSSVEELRRQREQLDREIEEREAAEQSSTPVGGGWR